MRAFTLMAAAGLAAFAGIAQAEPAPAPAAAPAQTAAAPSAKYSTENTQMGVLFADPAAKEVLKKHIPDLANKDDILERASGMTLKELQAAISTYAPDVLSDKVLAAIDADLAQIK